jgi:hypothetical protein
MQFCRYDLRTTDPEAARAFYADVLGMDFDASPSGGPLPLAVWPLHERARARGAPAHWLGQIGAADAEATVGHLLARGGERLGPMVRASDGTAFTVLRDPFGAVLGVRGDSQVPRHSPVVWHQLHTSDLEGSWTAYTELFGWTQTATVDFPDPPGGYRMFAWDGSGKSVGGMGNTARSPGVHAHWLFHFPVTDLDARVVQVRAKGGVVGGAAVLPNGDRIVGCEDPQGAAFGLYQAG